MLHVKKKELGFHRFIALSLVDFISYLFLGYIFLILIVFQHRMGKRNLDETTNESVVSEAGDATLTTEKDEYQALCELVSAQKLTSPKFSWFAGEPNCSTARQPQIGQESVQTHQKSCRRESDSRGNQGRSEGAAQKREGNLHSCRWGIGSIRFPKLIFQATCLQSTSTLTSRPSARRRRCRTCTFHRANNSDSPLAIVVRRFFSSWSRTEDSRSCTTKSPRHAAISPSSRPSTFTVFVNFVDFVPFIYNSCSSPWPHQRYVSPLWTWFTNVSFFNFIPMNCCYLRSQLTDSSVSCNPTHFCIEHFTSSSYTVSLSPELNDDMRHTSSAWGQSARHPRRLSDGQRIVRGESKDLRVGRRICQCLRIQRCTVLISIDSNNGRVPVLWSWSLITIDQHHLCFRNQTVSCKWSKCDGARIRSTTNCFRSTEPSSLRRWWPLGWGLSLSEKPRKSLIALRFAKCDIISIGDKVYKKRFSALLPKKKLKPLEPELVSVLVNSARNKLIFAERAIQKLCPPKRLHPCKSVRRPGNQGQVCVVDRRGRARSYSLPRKVWRADAEGRLDQCGVYENRQDGAEENGQGAARVQAAHRVHRLNLMFCIFVIFSVDFRVSKPFKLTFFPVIPVFWFSIFAISQKLPLLKSEDNCFFSLIVSSHFSKKFSTFPFSPHEISNSHFLQTLSWIA